jgi:hypothetical protein
VTYLRRPNIYNETNIGKVLGTKETHHLFVDFKPAYDGVWKEKGEIRYDMHKLGFPRKLANLCNVLNKEVYALVKIVKQISEEFTLS